MHILTIKEINEALSLTNTFDNEIKFSGVSIDTRTIKKGNLFIPSQNGAIDLEFKELFFSFNKKSKKV